MSETTQQHLNDTPRILLVHQSVYALLVQAANEGKLVSDILTPAIDLMKSRKSDVITQLFGYEMVEGADGKLHRKYSEKHPVMIRCSIIGRFCPLIGSKRVEFGEKAQSTTGFNTMSKEGNNFFASNNRKVKDLIAKAEAKIQTATEMLGAMKTKTDTETALQKLQQAQAEKKEAEALRGLKKTDSTQGFTTFEECLKYLENLGVQSMTRLRGNATEANPEFKSQQG